MADYLVSVPFTGFFTVTVEAEDEQAAKNLALEEMGKTAGYLDFVFDEGGEEEESPIEIGEWEVHNHVVKGNVVYAVQNSIEAELA